MKKIAQTLNRRYVCVEFPLLRRRSFHSYVSGDSLVGGASPHKEAELETCGRSLTHPSTQCAAVRIHLELMMEPPHRCSPLMCRLTCHGNCPGLERFPPTIRVVKRGREPHSDTNAGGQQVQYHMFTNTATEPPPHAEPYGGPRRLAMEQRWLLQC